MQKQEDKIKINKINESRCTAIKKKIVLFAGIALILLSSGILLYPAVSNAVNEAANNSTIKVYDNNVRTLSKAEKEKYLSEAQTYNNNLFADNFTSQSKSYKDILSFDNGQIGSIEIPKIKCNLPIYHGTGEEVLTRGAAHLANTSFPIGGENTHAVISAHTAYPGKIFFDNLTKLEKDDLFYIKVLDETLTYKVCDINIAEPDDTSKLQIKEGKDYVSLITCYPYAVNTHRIIVTGERVKRQDGTGDTVVNVSNNYTSNSLLYFFILIVICGAAILLIIRKVHYKNTCKKTVPRRDS